MNNQGSRVFFVLIAAGIALTLVLVGLGLRLEGRLGKIETEVLDRAPGAIPLEKLDASPEIVVRGQTVYVPVYSHIYHSGGKELPLEATLSIRNTDQDYPIIIRSVRYFDTEGRMIKEFIRDPAVLAPLAATDFLIERRDRTGGVGANFLVDWIAEHPVHEPVIEAVMVGHEGSRAVSFVSTGRPIAHLEPKDEAAGVR